MVKKKNKVGTRGQNEGLIHQRERDSRFAASVCPARGVPCPRASFAAGDLAAPCATMQATSMRRWRGDAGWQAGGSRVF